MHIPYIHLLARPFSSPVSRPKKSLQGTLSRCVGVPFPRSPPKQRSVLQSSQIGGTTLPETNIAPKNDGFQ